MCGILGTYNFDLSLSPLLEKQVHRGPDVANHCSLALDNGVSIQLGHNRLKIVCLSDEANQPIQDESTSHILTFNGEIYNYLEIQSELTKAGVVFHTNSDTEVLLKALKYWGMGALEKLNGMFAFAYFEKEAQKLYLVRDRFGVKPLYYFYDGQRLMFASTSRLIADTLKLGPNYTYLKKGLQYGIFEDDTEMTMYANLKSIRPGSYLQFSFTNASPQVHEYFYYHLPTRVDALQEQIISLSPNQLQMSVLNALEQASQQRLKADVPMALALSGGLDSSSIAVLAKQSSPTIEAFCFGDPLDKLSEGKLAKKLADKHQIKTHFVAPSTEDWQQAFWQTLVHQDAPFAGMSVVAQYLLYQKMNQHGYKVALGGQGGDEAFLGYRKFQLFYLKESLDNKEWGQAALSLANFGQMLWAERSRLSVFWQLRSKYSKSYKSKGLQLPGEPLQLNLGLTHDVRSRQIADILQFSLPTLLRYEDRNSMAHSIESRLPFMDYHLMELACALPVGMKLKNGYGKWVVRESMAGVIPNEIRLARYKRGFDVTSGNAIFKELMPSIQSKLTEKKDLFESYLPGENLEHYFSPAQLNQSQKRFTELMTLLWLGERA